MATCVFTCMNWFSMSRMTCFNIFSGFSARSTRSLRLARTSVATRSSNALTNSFSEVVRSEHSAISTQHSVNSCVPPKRRTYLLTCPCSLGFAVPFAWRQFVRPIRFVAERPYLAQQLRHLHARKRLEHCRHFFRHLRNVPGDLVQTGRVA